MSAVLKSTVCHVQASGEIVVASFGNLAFNMDHETAIYVAVDLRMMARRVKLVCADGSRSFSVQGTIHDANARPPETIIVGRVAKRFDYDVTTDGRVVQLRLQKTVIGIGYAEALKLAGWFRIAGKNARNNSGDIRHWSVIKNPDDAVNRAAEMVPG